MLTFYFVDGQEQLSLTSLVLEGFIYVHPCGQNSQVEPHPVQVCRYFCLQLLLGVVARLVVKQTVRVPVPSYSFH